MPTTDRTKRSRYRLAVSILVVSVGCGFLVAAQQPSEADKQVPAMTPVVVGQEMFRAYCVSCHGIDGKGQGPAALALKKSPPDLTLLSRKNGGTFPMGRVRSVIEGNDFVTEHGSREMPIWGDAFRTVNGDPLMVQLKVDHLVVYIESIQHQ